MSKNIHYNEASVQLGDLQKDVVLGTLNAMEKLGEIGRGEKLLIANRSMGYAIVSFLNDVVNGNEGYLVKNIELEDKIQSLEEKIKLLESEIKKKDQLLLYYYEGCDCTREEGCFKCRQYKRLNGDKDVR